MSRSHPAQERERHERQLIETSTLVARVVGDYTVPDLAFDDTQAAANSLGKLAAPPAGALGGRGAAPRRAPRARRAPRPTAPPRSASPTTACTWSNPSSTRGIATAASTCSS